MLGKAIYSQLTGDAAVLAIVGTRVYPQASTQNVYPLIAYEIEQENEDAISTMRGKEFFVTLTMVCGGPDVTDAYSQARTLSAAVKTALDRQSGTWGGINVGGCFFNGATEQEFTEGANSEALYVEVEHTYHVWAAA